MCKIGKHGVPGVPFNHARPGSGTASGKAVLLDFQPCVLERVARVVDVGLICLFAVMLQCWRITAMQQLQADDEASTGANTSRLSMWNS